MRRTLCRAFCNELVEYPAVRVYNFYGILTRG